MSIVFCAVPKAIIHKKAEKNNGYGSAVVRKCTPVFVTCFDISVSKLNFILYIVDIYLKHDLWFLSKLH